MEEVVGGAISDSTLEMLPICMVGAVSRDARVGVVEWCLVAGALWYVLCAFSKINRNLSLVLANFRVSSQLSLGQQWNI